MANNAIECILNDVTAANIYLQALTAAKKEERLRLEESIQEMLSDILVQAEIAKQHLIEKEKMIEQFRRTIIGVEDEIDSEEYEMKEPSRSSRIQGRGSSKSSKIVFREEPKKEKDIEEIIKESSHGEEPSPPKV